MAADDWRGCSCPAFDHWLGKHTPWRSKDYFLNGLSVKTIVLVGIYNQQFKGTILFMVFDFQGSGLVSYHKTCIVTT